MWGAYNLGTYMWRIYNGGGVYVGAYNWGMYMWWVYNWGKVYVGGL